MRAGVLVPSTTIRTRLNDRPSPLTARMSAEYWYDLPVIRPPMAVTFAAGRAPSTQAMFVVLVLVSVVFDAVPVPDVAPVDPVVPVDPAVLLALFRYSSRLEISVLTSSWV